MGALIASLAFVAWALGGSATTSCTGSSDGASTCTSTPLAESFSPFLLIPTAVTLIVWLLLRLYCTTGSRAAHAAAIAIAALCCVVCVLAMLSIGVLLAPVALLLIIAAVKTPPPAPRNA